MKTRSSIGTRGTGALALICALVTTGTGCGPQKGHWPQFRGPQRDLCSSETGLLKQWPVDGPPLVWKATGLGQGFSSVSVVDGMILTQGHFDGNEAVIALKESTGDLIWNQIVGPARLVEVPGSRSTPTVDGEHVYVQTVQGDLACLEKASGKIVWRRQLKKDFGGRSPGYGYSESPLVDRDRVICTPGGEHAALVALDKGTGETLWKAAVPEQDIAAYSSVIAIEVGGVRQYVQLMQKGVVGIRASDGVFLWREDSAANGSANCTTPVFHEGLIFGASAYANGGALVRLVPQRDRCSAELVYHTKHMKSLHGGFVILDGHIYGCDASILTCLNWSTGDVVWKDRSVGRGSVVYADGHLILRSETGPLALVEVTSAGYQEKGRFEQPDRSDQFSWAYPVIAGGRLYLRDQDLLLCYDVRDHSRN